MFKVSTFNEIEEKAGKIAENRQFGKITGVSGLVVQCKGLPDCAMGSRCQIETTAGEKRAAEVVGFDDGTTLVMPYGPVEGIGPGSRVFPVSQKPTVHMSNAFVGRVVNGLGEPVDGKGPIAMGGIEMFFKSQPPLASQRNPVGGRLDSGVRSVNTFTPICQGQRMGIFSGSGVGKSVLMSMIARYCTADVNVIGLVGERGREVREFIEEQLGEEGLKKSVVVVATSDEPPLMRRQAAYMAMTLGEYFRDQGQQVMLFIDSVTRFALAQREIGLSAGEPPTTRGFTPSVFAELPKLLERAGPGTGAGSISAIFTVLVEGGDLDEPVADAVRGIIDGHIVLDRELAERNHFPAINILKSISRMAPMCNEKSENVLINKARQLIATYTDMAELIRLGAYNKGSDPNVDLAIDYHDRLAAYLKQLPDERASLSEGFGQIGQILAPLMENSGQSTDEST